MNETTKDIYTTGEYLLRNPSWHEEDSPWKAKQIFSMINKHNLRPKSVCEVGCGAGEILNRLHDVLPQDVYFTGYEISPDAYELAKGRSKERLQFRERDFLEDSSHYDILLLIDVIEHVEDYYNFLRSIQKRADYKIFHIPLDISVQKILLNRPIKRRQRFGHIQYFMKETAVATLKDTGYEIMDLFYTSILLDTPAKSLIPLLGKWGLKVSTTIFRAIFNEDAAIRLLGGHSLMVLAK